MNKSAMVLAAVAAICGLAAGAETCPADGTGAVAFILLALLGVEEQEIWLDWESSAFWNANPKWLNYGNFNRLRAVFAAYEGATINKKVENYVLSLGFSAEEIEHFRKLMLGDCI